MQHVDGYALPVSKKNLLACRRLASRAGKLWVEHGALESSQSVRGNAEVSERAPSLVKLKRGEMVVFSWVVFESPDHREQVHARMRQEPRFTSMDPSAMPFDCERMVAGQFESAVAHGAPSRA